MIWNLWRRIEKLGSLIDAGPPKIESRKISTTTADQSTLDGAKITFNPTCKSASANFFFSSPATVFYGSLWMKSWTFEGAVWI